MNDYLRLHERARDGAFVCWIAIIVPAEIFSGFDNVVYAVPESHAAMSAGKGVGPLQCAKAESLGYSLDLCSYARIDLGTAFDGGKDSPTFGLPRPISSSPTITTARSSLSGSISTIAPGRCRTLSWTYHFATSRKNHRVLTTSTSSTGISSVPLSG